MGEWDEDFVMVDSLSASSRAYGRMALIALICGVTLLVWAGSAHAANPRKGATVYGQYCADCHGNRGVPNMPGIPDFSRNQRLMQSDLALVKSISIGKGMMPAFQGRLTENDILDVIAYLRTLQ
jgi:cytochrome c6